MKELIWATLAATVMSFLLFLSGTYPIIGYIMLVVLIATIIGVFQAMGAKEAEWERWNDP